MKTTTAEQLIEDFRGGDKHACEELLERFTPMIWKIVNRACRNLRLDEGAREDLFQYGQILLWRCADKKFDPSRGVKFFTFAYGNLGFKIWSKAMRTGGVIYVSRLNAYCESEAITQAKKRAMAIRSLDAPMTSINGDTAKHTLGTILTHKHKEENYDRNAEMRERLKVLLDRLTYKEREIIKGRMAGISLAGIGKFMGISRERVSQIEERGLEKLKGLAKQNGTT